MTEIEYIASVRRWHAITQQEVAAAMIPPVDRSRVMQIERGVKAGPRSRQRMMDAIINILEERQ